MNKLQFLKHALFQFWNDFLPRKQEKILVKKCVTYSFQYHFTSLSLARYAIIHFQTPFFHFPKEINLSKGMLLSINTTCVVIIGTLI
jgi:hypothetical protein